MGWDLQRQGVALKAQAFPWGDVPVLAKVVEACTCSQALVEAVCCVAASPMTLGHVNEHVRDPFLCLLKAKAQSPHLRDDETVHQITHSSSEAEPVSPEVIPPSPWPPCWARLKPIADLEALLLPPWEGLVLEWVLRVSRVGTAWS